MSAPQEHARIIVQCDWNEVLRRNNGTAWVTFRKAGLPSVYGELKTRGVSADGVPYVVTSDGFSAPEVGKKTISVQYQDGTNTCQYRFVSPLVTFYAIHEEKKSVLDLDVTPGGLAVSCDTDSKLKVWTPENGEVRRNLEGHYGDVYTSQFFPSGVVILTGGADTQVKIWAVETGLCAATLQGHRAGITSTATVERGRNIVSSSRDGTVKLWDVGQTSCVTTFDQCQGGIINSCCLQNMNDTIDLGTPNNPPSEREVLTEGKLLLVACENGTVKGFGLQSRKKVFDVGCEGAINCCTFVSPSAFACGTQDGHLYVIDIRNPSSPLYHSKESRGPLLSLLPYQQGCFVSSGDGSCFFVSEDFSSTLELTGSDCDPVYKVVTDNSFIYTACRDGAVRKYRLP